MSFIGNVRDSSPPADRLTFQQSKASLEGKYSFEGKVKPGYEDEKMARFIIDETIVVETVNPTLTQRNQEFWKGEREKMKVLENVSGKISVAGMVGICAGIIALSVLLLTAVAVSSYALPILLGVGAVVITTSLLINKVAGNKKEVAHHRVYEWDNRISEYASQRRLAKSRGFKAIHSHTLKLFHPMEVESLWKTWAKTEFNKFADEFAKEEEKMLAKEAQKLVVREKDDRSYAEKAKDFVDEKNDLKFVKSFIEDNPLKKEHLSLAFRDAHVPKELEKLSEQYDRIVKDYSTYCAKKGYRPDEEAVMKEKVQILIGKYQEWASSESNFGSNESLDSPPLSSNAGSLASSASDDGFLVVDTSNISPEEFESL